VIQWHSQGAWSDHDHQSQLPGQASWVHNYISSARNSWKVQQGKEEVAWFLRNRTYVDDAAEGVHDKEAAMKISQGMEVIIEKGEFWFKETVITGDMLDEPGQLQEVLSLRWDSEKDEISVDMEITYGKVKYGICPEDSPSAELPRDQSPGPDNYKSAMKSCIEPIWPTGSFVCQYGEVAAVDEEGHDEGEVRRLGNCIG
jgi:hypothetical protein